MALDINTGYSSAFKAFVDFAEKTNADGYDSASAKATLSSRTITVSPLSLHETSYFLRKGAEEKSNDATRALFRAAIIDMFGGEDKIPENVKDAMRLNDYGHGKPLTARQYSVSHPTERRPHATNRISAVGQVDVPLGGTTRQMLRGAFCLDISASP